MCCVRVGVECYCFVLLVELCLLLVVVGCPVFCVLCVGVVCLHVVAC